MDDPKAAEPTLWDVILVAAGKDCQRLNSQPYTAHQVGELLSRLANPPIGMALIVRPAIARTESPIAVA